MSDIDEFLDAESIAVCGASADRSKYGNRVFRALVDGGMNVFPINPRNEEIEGHHAFANLSSLPQVPVAVSIVTPPEVTKQVVSEAVTLGVKHLWMQPGAEDAQASQLARAAGLTVIDDGRCILVALSRRSHNQKKTNE